MRSFNWGMIEIGDEDRRGVADWSGYRQTLWLGIAGVARWPFGWAFPAPGGFNLARRVATHPGCPQASRNSAAPLRKIDWERYSIEGGAKLAGRRPGRRRGQGQGRQGHSAGCRTFTLKRMAAGRTISVGPASN